MFWLTCSAIVAVALTIFGAYMNSKGVLDTEDKLDVTMGLILVGVLATLLAPLTILLTAIIVPLVIIFIGAKKCFK